MYRLIAFKNMRKIDAENGLIIEKDDDGEIIVNYRRTGIYTYDPLVTFLEDNEIEYEDISYLTYISKDCKFFNES
jgi:hypothetical protein